MLQALGLYLIPRCSSLTSLTLTYALVAFTWNFLTTAGNTFVLWISREQQVGMLSTYSMGTGGC